MLRYKGDHGQVVKTLRACLGRGHSCLVGRSHQRVLNMRVCKTLVRNWQLCVDGQEWADVGAMETIWESMLIA